MEILTLHGYTTWIFPILKHAHGTSLQNRNHKHLKIVGPHKGINLSTIDLAPLCQPSASRLELVAFSAITVWNFFVRIQRITGLDFNPTGQRHSEGQPRQKNIKKRIYWDRISPQTQWAPFNSKNKYIFKSSSEFSKQWKFNKHMAQRSSHALPMTHWHLAAHSPYLWPREVMYQSFFKSIRSRSPYWSQTAEMNEKILWVALTCHQTLINKINLGILRMKKK